MQRSNSRTFVLCLAVVAFMFGCEVTDSIDNADIDQRTVLDNSHANKCDLGEGTLTIQGDKLKVLKEKDLKKKKYQVEVVFGGTSYVDGTVTTKGLMTIDYVPSGFGTGTASVYEVQIKDNKEKLIASCEFTIDEPEVEEPEVEQPEVEEPEVEQPEVEEPEVEEPEVEQPEVEEPEVEQPEVEEPEVEQPEVEEPEVEEPEVEQPEVEDDGDGQDKGGCQICPPGTPIFDSPVCTHIVNAAPSFEQGSEACESIVSMANGAGCCGDGPPDPCDFEPPKVEHVGPYPSCDLCRDGDYPNNTGMVLNFLYLGEGSCAQYYVYGLQGNIPTHMCDTVQYFAYEPCGCGEFNLREKECREKE